MSLYVPVCMHMPAHVYISTALTKAKSLESQAVVSYDMYAGKQTQVSIGTVVCTLYCWAISLVRGSYFLARRILALLVTC